MVSESTALRLFIEKLALRQKSIVSVLQRKGILTRDEIIKEEKTWPLNETEKTYATFDLIFNQLLEIPESETQP